MDIASMSCPPDPICEPCIAGKQHHPNVPKVAQNHAKVPLELLHMDLYGPLSVSTPEGHQYWHLIVDDCSRIWGLFLLCHKSEAFPAFQRFVHWAENKLGLRVKSARDDKGGEWMSKEQQQWCIEQGIERQHTIRNEPHQNGVAEHANQSLANGATSLLVESNLPPSFWGYAI
jgi:transposase InsO family protein